MSLKPVRRSRRHRNNHPRLEGGDWNFNWKKRFFSFEPSKHKRFLAVLVLFFIALGFVGWQQDPNNRLFHSMTNQGPHVCQPGEFRNPGMSCDDPLTTLWNGTGVSGDLSEFNVVNGLVSYATSCFGASTPNCVFMQPNASTTAVALSKSTVGELSTASKSNLEFFFTLRTNSVPNANVGWGYYLTTNGTVPTHNIGDTSSYEPGKDPSVVLIVTLQCVSSCGVSGNQQWTSDVQGLRTLDKSQTINNEDAQCSQAGSRFICQNQQTVNVGPGVGTTDSVTYLNYTGVTSNNVPCSLLGGLISQPSTGCSWNLESPNQVNSNQYWKFTQNLPWVPIQGQQYYLGLFDRAGSGANIEFSFDQKSPTYGMFIGKVDVTGPGPSVDTGGFFGPVIKALITIGVFILNAILGFIAFIAPALQTALNFLESIMVNALNGLGNALGLGNVGTDLQNLINSLVTFFGSGNFGSIFTNLPALFARFIDSLAVYFPWLTPALSAASITATFGIKGIGFVVTIVGFTMQFVAGAAATYFIVFYFVYTGDDSLAGILALVETSQFIIFGLGLKYLAYLVNFVLDVVTAIIGVIPKPFVQMVAHKLPRIPIVEVSARFIMPSGNMSEIRNGNLLAAACWVSGILFLDMYETASPALPGSIGFLLPSALSAITPLSGFIPLLEILTAFVWGAAFLVVPINWFSNAFDFGEIPFSAAIGEKISAGPGAIHVRKAGKHFQGRLEKKVGARAELKALREHPEREEQVRERELREAHGKDIEGPRL